MSLEIRPAVPADYEAIAAMESAAFNYPISADDVASRLAMPGMVGLAAEQNGRVVGMAGAGYNRSITPQGDLRCLIYVVPEARRSGVGGALWHALLEAVQAGRPVHLRANGSPNDQPSTDWAMRRGFQVTQHLKYQHLDVTAFDPSAFAAQVANAQDNGFRFVPLREIQTPETEQRVYELYHACDADTPDNNEKEQVSFEKWRAWALDVPEAWTEGWIVALAPDGDWAGFTMTHKSGADMGHVYMTGMARPYRGQGLAVPMRTAALTRAREAGLKKITTLNHVANAPMLAVNRRLGFRVVDEIYRLVRHCQW